jgi:exopolyphosphatase/guanosine-5'-triphosphate,3'-diphosphate pyrophosphatase
MLSAAIDVGSNTLRLLIGAIHKDRVSRIYADRAITRLAEGTRETGTLRKKNMMESVSVLREFSQSIARYGVSCVKAVGTSALREANNSRDFVTMAFQETGIRIGIIPGEKEAELTAQGVLLGMENTDSPSLIIDIGGGSTEWIIQGQRAPHGSNLFGSIPLGVVHLLEKYIKTDPPFPGDISAMNHEIDSRLRPVKDMAMHSFTPQRLVGTGGTITTLASMDLGLNAYDHTRIHLHPIPFARLSQWRDKVLSLTLSMRMGIHGLEPERADLIIPGILLTIRIMNFFRFSEITVSDYGLLEGLLKETHHESCI